MTVVSSRRVLSLTLAVSAALGGALLATHYARLGLTLSHYDARGRMGIGRALPGRLRARRRPERHGIGLPAIERTLYAPRSTIEHVHRDHGCADVTMAE